MNKANNLWTNLAPYWEFLENRHMNISVVENLLNELSSPVLIIGAGQGLLVKYLKEKGFTVVGLDLDKEMIKYAKERHSIDLIHGDASSLPFKNSSYKSVIISSGVVDYTDDKALIKRILDESIRVTAGHGKIFVAFYQITPNVERFYKKIGVIDKNKLFHYQRIFFIDENSSHPFRCIFQIMKWTSKGFFNIGFSWAKIGLTFPEELSNERENINKIFDLARKNKFDPEILKKSFPDNIPYWNKIDVDNLLSSLGFLYNDIVKFDECMIVKFYKSGILNVKNDKPKSGNEIADNIITLSNISKKYKNRDRFALSSLNLSIKIGQIFGLLGPNGAGKTTLLSIISGLLKPTSGKVMILDEKDKKNFKSRIGYVPQELALYARLTGRENLEFFGSLYDLEKEILKERTDELLTAVGLKDRENDIVKNYSLGMMRRLNLAVGLINNPRLILMDEPTVGIDPQSRNHIFELILNLKKNGATIIYTTHYIEEATKLCDNVAIIDRGKILLEGSPKELVDKYGFSRIIFNLESKVGKDYLTKLLNIDSVIDVSVNKNSMHLITSNQKRNIEIIEEVHRISNENKIKLNLFQIINPNLETLFLDLTGRYLRDSTEEEPIGGFTLQ